MLTPQALPQVPGLHSLGGEAPKNLKKKRVRILKNHVRALPLWGKSKKGPRRITHAMNLEVSSFHSKKEIKIGREEVRRFEA